MKNIKNMNNYSNNQGKVKMAMGIAEKLIKITGKENVISKDIMATKAVIIAVVNEMK